MLLFNKVANMISHFCLLAFSGCTQAPTGEILTAEEAAIRRVAIGVVSYRIAAENRTIEDFREWVKSIEKPPIYQRISAARAALPSLGDGTKVEFRGGIPDKETQDLSTRSGRAALIIEIAIGRQIKKIHNGANEKRPVRYDLKMAESAIAHFADGAAALSRENLPAELEARLKQRYAGKLRMGAPVDRKGGAIFTEDLKANAFLKEWFPIDKSFKQLEEFLGPPDMRRGKIAYYTIEDGYGTGSNYYFHLDGDRIDFVEIDNDLE